MFFKRKLKATNFCELGFSLLKLILQFVIYFLSISTFNLKRWDVNVQFFRYSSIYMCVCIYIWFQLHLE